MNVAKPILSDDEIARFDSLRRFAERKVRGPLSADGTALYYDIIAAMVVVDRLVDELESARSVDVEAGETP